MVKIVSRAKWGARSPRSRSTVSWSARTGFTVHYSSGPPSQTPRQIQNFHLDGRGWSDVAYNFLVDEDGTAFEGRGWTVVGAHAAPHNSSHIGVCFIGRDGDVTPAAKATIRALYDEACRRAGKTLRKTYHGGLSGNSTSCPGRDLREWVQDGMPVDGSSGGSKPSPSPAPSPGKAPAFPLRKGYYFGPRSGPAASVSGYYSHRADLRRWQTRMKSRGWTLAADGLYGPETARVARAFQAEKRLTSDGLIGRKTWDAAWTAPVT